MNNIEVRVLRAFELRLSVDEIARKADVSTECAESIMRTLHAAIPGLGFRIRDKTFCMKPTTLFKAYELQKRGRKHAEERALPADDARKMEMLAKESFSRAKEVEASAQREWALAKNETGRIISKSELRSLNIDSLSGVYEYVLLLRADIERKQKRIEFLEAGGFSI